MKPSLLSSLLFCLALGLAPTLYAQERPQETRPAPSPERQREIRDSIRAIGRERFRIKEEGTTSKTRYQADRALFMPRMERTSIFRIGIPGWLMRFGLTLSRDEFDTQEEYRAARKLSKRIRGLRVAAFVDNAAYSQQQIVEDYAKFVKRRRGEPVMVVKAPLGGVQIHVKERRGRVKLISLIAYGEDGAAIVRLKANISGADLAQALQLMTETAESTAGVEIDAEG